MTAVSSLALLYEPVRNDGQATLTDRGQTPEELEEVYRLDGSWKSSKRIISSGDQTLTGV
jgi:hypothetical protein